jgi:hypothetical protein
MGLLFWIPIAMWEEGEEGEEEDVGSGGEGRLVCGLSILNALSLHEKE